MFTDDPLVRESLGFLMTREIAHFQMFTAALNDIQPNFPPGVNKQTGEVRQKKLAPVVKRGSQRSLQT